MKTVKLITCDDAFQAHVIQGALENEGIASVLHNENMSSVMRGYVRDVTGVDIFVYEDEYELDSMYLRHQKTLILFSFLYPLVLFEKYHSKDVQKGDLLL
mgnify:CR=1 FL=1